MYRNKLIRYLPWIVFIPVVWMTINLYFGYTSTFVLFSLVVAYGFVTSLILYVYLKVEKIILYSNKFGIENAPREYKIHLQKMYDIVTKFDVYEKIKDKKLGKRLLEAKDMIINDVIDLEEIKKLDDI